MQAASGTPTPRRITIDWKWFKVWRLVMFSITTIISQVWKTFSTTLSGNPFNTEGSHQRVQNKQWRSNTRGPKSAFYPFKSKYPNISWQRVWDPILPSKLPQILVCSTYCSRLEYFTRSCDLGAHLESLQEGARRHKLVINNKTNKTFPTRACI